MSTKVALVYDRVNKWGGAERVLLTLHEMFPDAPLFTSLYDEKKAPWAKVFPKVYTSFLQKIPFAKSNHELFGWLMPFVFGNAVKKAMRVIVPSQAVRDEVCYYYKLNTQKVIVTYEGI